MERNKTLVQFFDWYCAADGAHWDRFRQELPFLQSLGISAAWLPPAYKGTRGPTSEGYDVYDLYDLGEFDQKGSVRTKYGTKEQYVRAVGEARKMGIEVYADIVLNHMGGAEETETFLAKKVDPDNRLHFISKELEVEAYTRFLFPGRKGKYSNFQWNYQCFTGIDYAVNREENAIFKILNDYGEAWEPLVHSEKGNFDFLILNDIETRNPAVRAELKKWIRWFYETAAFDGIRLDAVKHINPLFFIEWLDYIRAEINPSLFVLGEYWLSDDLPVLLRYLEAIEDRMSLFDAPLHHNFSIASSQKDKFDLRAIFFDSLVGAKPEQAVTFVDNHDTQPLQSLEEFTEQWFKPHAYALILLREKGYPCVFYADLYGSCYTGENKLKKQTTIELTPIEALPALLQARKKYAYGKQTDYFNHPNCIGWTRRGDDSMPGSGCAVLISNHPQLIFKKYMLLGAAFAAKIFQNMLDLKDRIQLDGDGGAEFFVRPEGVAVWVVKAE